MDFVRSYFDTNEPLTSADLEKKLGQKCSTGQRFICTEVTSYKIHILEGRAEILVIFGWHLGEMMTS